MGHTNRKAKRQKSSKSTRTSAVASAATKASPKVWGGRFAKSMAQELIDFNASIDFDKRLAKEDVEGSIAHAKMLGRAGLLTESEARLLVKSLEKIAREIQEDQFTFRKEDEDVHMNVERRLVELAGDLGRKIHMGRSRNDQVALDTRLYTRAAVDHLADLVRELQAALVKQAEQHVDDLLPGYTHLQHAQPIRLAHHLLAYFEMFQRDRERLQDMRRRVNQMPLGSGALASSTLPLDRDDVAKSLQFEGITRNSLDAVSDRDYIAEFLSACAIIQMHLSRMAEEWILWSTTEFGFVDIDESLCTGSSMMPQKKNPDLPELVRGKMGRVLGNYVGLMTVMKGLPLAYNKDLQEDKEPLFDSYDAVAASVGVMTRVVEGSTFEIERMLEGAKEPLLLATDLAEHLVKSGVPFRTAHEIVGRTVRESLSTGKSLLDFTIADFQKISDRYDASVLGILNVRKSVDARDLPGGTGKTAVREALRDARKRLSR